MDIMQLQTTKNRISHFPINSNNNMANEQTFEMTLNLGSSPKAMHGKRSSETSTFYIVVVLQKVKQQHGGRAKVSVSCWLHGDN
jgi:hypothetical protein